MIKDHFHDSSNWLFFCLMVIINGIIISSLIGASGHFNHAFIGFGIVFFFTIVYFTILIVMKANAIQNQILRAQQSFQKVDEK